MHRTQFRTDPAERLQRRIECDPNSGCWLWTGSRNQKGYGYFSLDGRNRKAHVVSWEMVSGPVPHGLQLDHLCNTPSCVNPSHLRPVTAAENCRRSNSPWAINARKTHCNSGHAFTQDNIYLYRGWRHCLACMLARREVLKARRRVLASTQIANAAAERFVASQDRAKAPTIPADHETLIASFEAEGWSRKDAEFQAARFRQTFRPGTPYSEILRRRDLIVAQREAARRAKARAA